MAPQVLEHPGARTTRRHLMAIEKSSAPHAHPLTEDLDDTIEAHYACLERPCCCLEGWVFVGYVDEHGERGKPPTGVAAARKADSPTRISHTASETTRAGVSLGVSRP